MRIHKGVVRRIAVFVVPIILLAAALGYLSARGVLRRHRSLQSLQVEAVERRSIAVTIEAAGIVEPVDLVEVKSKASGQILRMPVEAGSVVKAGDLLAQIDTVDVKNQYEQALAAERAAQAKVDISTAQKERADTLFSNGFLTVDEHETTVLDYANAEAQLVKTKTDLDTARQRRDDATVRAPIAGTVLEQLVSTGQVISSATSSVSGGTSLLRMADLGRIRMRAYVSETDIGKVRRGQKATVTVEAFPQRPFVGTVEKIEPQAVVQQSVTMFPVLISISNEEGLLLPGMNGEVSMLVDQRDDVPSVSLDAVRTMRDLATVAAALDMDADSIGARLMRDAMMRMGRDGGGPAGGRPQFAFVRTSNGLEPRLVRLGLSDFDHAQVLDGLKEGEEVALLSIAEAEAQRKSDQTRLQQRIGNGIPGSTGSGSGRSATSGGGGIAGGGAPPPPPPGGP